VKVTDTSGGSSSNTFVLSVASVNDPPTFNPIADLDIDEDSGPVNVELTGLSAGPLNELQNLIITAGPRNTILTPAPGGMYSPHSSMAPLRIVPLRNNFGDLVLTVRLDGVGASRNLFVLTFPVHVHPS